MKKDFIPKKPDLETETLAIIAQNPGERLCSKLTKEDFTHPRNVFFPVMEALGGTLTQPRLRDQLDKAEIFTEGMETALADIYAYDPLPASIFHDNVTRLKNLTKRRQAMTLASEIERDAPDLTREFSLDDKAKSLLAADGVSPFADMLSRSAMAGGDFLSRRFPSRPLLVGDWFCKADLGFVFAPRGVGKTWFAHMLIKSLTAGKDLGPWHVPSKERVCLLDGEMPPDAVQERLNKLNVDGDQLTVLSHQCLFDLCGRGFQMGDAEQRKALLDYCAESEIQVLVIDNLSSVSNVSENDNDEWMELGDWLLDFRRKGISVIVVHHAGRNGNMRGASRREATTLLQSSLPSL